MLLHEIYSQSLLKCFIIIFKSIHETRTLTGHTRLFGWRKPTRKAKFSYCHRLMTFRIVSFHCSNLFHFCTPVSIEQLFSIDISEVEKLLCVIWYSLCETFKTCPPFRPLNESVLQETGQALPTLKKLMITLNLFTLHIK